MLKNRRPSSLRGDFDRDKYFEGWFQKIYSVEHQSSFVIIYGYATRNANDSFGFIQLRIPEHQPLLMYFPKEEVICDPVQHHVRIGEHLLTTEDISINTDEIGINLKLIDNQPIRTFKNSMGYSYVIPNLPCYHAVLNKSHLVSGEVRNRNASYSFDSEMGYLEKNWGTSFPENYVWLHALDPKDPGVSLLFSQAEIKWLGRTFVKHVGHFQYEGNTIDLRQLWNSVISIVRLSSEKHLIRILSKSIQIEISINLAHHVLFKGPNDGNLTRDIIHHTDALIDFTVKHKSATSHFQLVGNYENIGNLTH